MGARAFWSALLLFALAASAPPAAARSPLAPTSEQRLPDGQRVLVLCYHDVVAALPPDAEPETIDTATLAAHLNWLQTEGYVAIDLDRLLRAYTEGARLPERAVLLTFDDGYQSAYTQVFPLLRAFGTPAVIALVGQWMETGAGQSVRYGERDLPRERFLSWDQARQMQASGLVEFASHSWDLHRGIAGDAAGSMQPAATTHMAQAGGRYEDDGQWSARVRADLERNNAILSVRLGRHPRAIAWPYGRYNTELEAIAQSLGLPVGLTLDSGRDDQSAPVGRVRRLLVDRAASPIRQFARSVRQEDDAPTVRWVQVDVDRLVSGDADTFELRLNTLLERIRQLGAQQVVLPACAPVGPSGRIEAVYFHNRRVPVRADRLGRIAWRIATATQAKVYAGMPLAGVALAPTPEDPDGERRLGDLFEDLGKSVYLRGVVLGPIDPGPAPEELSARAAGLAARTRAWQPELASALMLAPAQASELPAQILAALRQHAYLVIDRRAHPNDPSDEQLAAAIRSIGGAAARTVVALTVQPGQAADAARHARDLLREGLPNLGLAGADLDADAVQFATLRRALSLQSQLDPAPPRGGR